jgi:hypothetical protein
MNPSRMGLEEQTEAHALLAKAANHPDWRVASHALDELMRRAVGPAPAAGGRGALDPAWCLQEITRGGIRRS